MRLGQRLDHTERATLDRREGLTLGWPRDAAPLHPRLPRWIVRKLAPGASRPGSEVDLVDALADLGLYAQQSGERSCGLARPRLRAYENAFDPRAGKACRERERLESALLVQAHVREAPGEAFACHVVRGVPDQQESRHAADATRR